MNGKEYVDKYFTKQELIDKLPNDYCPMDFGCRTSYSSKKCNSQNHQFDCEKCWASKVVGSSRKV